MQTKFIICFCIWCFFLKCAAQTYPADSTKTVCNYVDSFLEGDCVISNSSGKVIAIKKYHNNLQEGYCFQFFPTGNVSNLELWEKGRLKKYIDYYDNGVVREIVNFNANDEYDGLYLEFFENGKVAKEAEYKTLRCISNGNVKEIKDSVANVYSGSYKEYFINGMIKIRGHYSETNCFENLNHETVKGSIHSKENDAIMISIQHLPIKEGAWEYYDSNGNILKIELWVKGYLKN